MRIENVLDAISSILSEQIRMKGSACNMPAKLSIPEVALRVKVLFRP